MSAVPAHLEPYVSMVDDLMWKTYRESGSPLGPAVEDRNLWLSRQPRCYETSVLDRWLTEPSRPMTATERYEFARWAHEEMSFEAAQRVCAETTRTRAAAAVIAAVVEARRQGL